SGNNHSSISYLRKHNHIKSDLFLYIFQNEAAHNNARFFPYIKWSIACFLKNIFYFCCGYYLNMKIKKKRDALLSQKTIMRKIHLLLALFVFTFSFSQIKVLKNENLVEIGKENAIALYKKQNKYVFNYQDINNSNLNTYRSF